MVLPAEILDHIFSFLQSDTATLEVCSKTHPILSPLVERYLYMNITIQDGHDEIFNVLRDRPYIANYIQALKIKSHINDTYLMKLSTLLPKLLMLRGIELDFTGTMSKWQMLPESFGLAFLDCLGLPSLTDVSIISIAFPLPILNRCKHIQHLSLRFWRHDPAPMAEGLLAIGSLALHSCLWSMSPSSVSAICSWMESCHLSSLEFSDAVMQTYSFEPLRRILISCSHSLTSLVVDIDTRYGSIYGRDRTGIYPDMIIPIPFTHLRKLQRLTIRTQLHRLKYNSWALEFTSPIFTISKALKAALPLKLLSLDLQSSFEFHNYLDAQNQITSLLCLPLHSLLVQSASRIDSIHLRFKSIPIHGTQGISLSSSAFIAILAAHSDLTQFVESGKLVLEPVV